MKVLIACFVLLFSPTIFTFTGQAPAASDFPISTPISASSDILLPSGLPSANLDLWAFSELNCQGEITKVQVAYGADTPVFHTSSWMLSRELGPNEVLDWSNNHDAESRGFTGDLVNFSLWMWTANATQKQANTCISIFGTGGDCLRLWTNRWRNSGFKWTVLH